MTRIEWGDKSIFAEVAETLGLTVPEIFAATPSNDRGQMVPPTQATGVVAIYQPGVTEENVETQPVYKTLLIPDADGILRQVGTPVEIPGFLEKVLGGMENLLEGDENGEG